jgi:hypothetical protein
MMDLFNNMIKKMKDGGKVTFDIDSLDVNEEAFTTTLVMRYNEGGDRDEDNDMEERDENEGE